MEKILKMVFVSFSIGLFALGLYACSESSGSSLEDEKVVRPVEIYKATPATLSEWLPLSGEVLGELEVEVYSEIPERITSIQVQVGDYVKKGQLLLTMRKGSLSDTTAASVAGLSAARVGLSASEKDLQRTKKLHKAGLATDAQLSQLEVAVEGARAQLMQLEASVKQSKTMEDKTVITAPIHGYVGDINYDNGDMASPQMPLMTVVRFERVKIKAYAPDLEFSKLKTGLKAVATSKAAPGKELVGTISYISPIVDRISRTISVEAIFDNKDYSFRPGMLAELRIKTQDYEDGITIPNQALLNHRADNTATVFVHNNSIAKKVEVITGYRSGQWIQIEKGLHANDQVIVLGQHLLRDNDPVNVTSVHPSYEQTAVANK